MRTIKFRVWDKLSKVMRYEAENNLVVVLNNPDFEVMQFTGLLDKFGKEIYEGDIVKSIEGGLGSGQERIDVVKWQNESGGEGYEKAEFVPLNHIWFSVRTAEVIGNIYENKELLTSN